VARVSATELSHSCSQKLIELVSVHTHTHTYTHIYTLNLYTYTHTHTHTFTHLSFDQLSRVGNASNLSELHIDPVADSLHSHTHCTHTTHTHTHTTHTRLTNVPTHTN